MCAQCLPLAQPESRTQVRPSRLAGLLARLRLALTVHRERAALAELDERALADLGIPRHLAQAESARGLFDLPVGRKAE